MKEAGLKTLSILMNLHIGHSGKGKTMGTGKPSRIWG